MSEYQATRIPYYFVTLFGMLVRDFGRRHGDRHERASQKRSL